jgi:hypothetical protein
VSKRTERNNRRRVYTGRNPLPASVQMLIAFRVLGYRMYEGTVPAAVKARRRAANRRAGIARRANR